MLRLGMDDLDTLTHRPGTLGLMRRCLGSGIDGTVHVIHRLLHRLLQTRTVAQHLQALTALRASLSDGRYRLLGTALQRSDMGLDIARGLLGLAGQGSHFVGHHRETTPALPARAASMAALSASRLVCSAMD